MRVTVQVSVALPELPVTVTTYVPEVVPGLPEPPPTVPPPPQAIKPPARPMSDIPIPSMIRQLRRRFGTPKRSRQPRARLPAKYKEPPGNFGRVIAAEVAGWVVMARVAVSALTPVILTGLLEPKLNVGRS